MKKLNWLLIALLVLTSMTFSCSNDSALFQEIEQETQLKGVNLSADEFRAIRPGKSNGKSDTTENYGEKGQDRRTILDNNQLSFFETELPITIWSSALYVHKHDHEKGECILKFYWAGYHRMGDNYYWEDKSTNNLVYIALNELNHFNHNAIKMEFLGGERTYVTSTPYYEVEDEFIIPSSICEHCERVDIKITDSMGRITRLSQPFISDPTKSPYTPGN